MKILTKITFIFIIFLVITGIFIISDGLIDKVNKSDLLVILGNKVESNGLPSERLKSRLDKGFDIYMQGLASYILVSGGLGKEGYDEAEVMKNYLVTRGVSEDKIIIDNNGTDSWNTAKNTKEFMNKKSLSSVIIISNYYHISRIKLALKKLSVEKIYSSHANYFEFRDLYSIPREIIAYYYYLLR